MGELLGRVIVIAGIAGIVGVVGRICAHWLSDFYKSRPR
jgi:hypothetical protein